jgi:hypothetical protein
MTRVCGIATIVIATAAAALVAVGDPSRRDGLEVSAMEAASVRGGQCGNYQMIANAACTDSADDSCTSATSDCDGLCPYACSSTSTYSGSGTFSGALAAGDCDSVSQPSCTETVCSVVGAPVACCACLSGSNVECGPSPFDLDPMGCSGT